MALNAYIAATQLLLHDTNAQFYQVSNLTTYINSARLLIAIESQSVRIIPPSSGGITSISVTNGGSGYLTPPTVSINAGGTGSGATFTAVLTGTSVTSVTVNTAGSGYSYPALVNFTSSTGSGAIASVVIGSGNLNVTVPQQEVYTFASANSTLPAGYSQIMGVLSIAVNQGAWKPVLRYYPWGSLQAYARSYNTSVSNYPAIWSQYGQGVSGSVYLYPIPSNVFSMDWDCYCTPIALALDSDPEVLPYPWTDIVPYYAAYLAYLNAQRNDDAANMLNTYRTKVMAYGGYARPIIVPSYYGRRW
jgi:hypothetical protein